MMALMAVMELSLIHIYPFAVLLIGVDTSGRAGRSDGMMLASIDPQAGRIRLVSFLRDLYVTIPGHGKDRLNAAYF